MSEVKKIYYTVEEVSQLLGVKAFLYCPETDGIWCPRTAGENGMLL